MSNADLNFPLSFKEWLPTIIIVMLLMLTFIGVGFQNNFGSGKVILGEMGLLQSQEVQSVSQNDGNVEIKWRRNPSETLVTSLPATIIIYKPALGGRIAMKFNFHKDLLDRNFKRSADEQIASPGFLIENLARSGSITSVEIYQPGDDSF